MHDCFTEVRTEKSRCGFNMDYLFKILQVPSCYEKVLQVTLLPDGSEKELFQLCFIHNVINSKYRCNKDFETFKNLDCPDCPVEALTTLNLGNTVNLSLLFILFCRLFGAREASNRQRLKSSQKRF